MTAVSYLFEEVRYTSKLVNYDRHNDVSRWNPSLRLGELSTDGGLARLADRMTNYSL